MTKLSFIGIAIISLLALSINSQEICNPIFTYHGCYGWCDNSCSDCVSMGTNFATQQCLETCSLWGFQYGALQNGGECKCCSKKGIRFSEQGCNMRCYANEAETCGGSNRKSLYDSEFYFFCTQCNPGDFLNSQNLCQECRPLCSLCVNGTECTECLGANRIPPFCACAPGFQENSSGVCEAICSTLFNHCSACTSTQCTECDSPDRNVDDNCNCNTGMVDVEGECITIVTGGGGIKIPLDGYDGLQIGTRWDTYIDVDSNILMIRADNTIHDYVSYFRLTSGDGSVHLNGDDVTGTGDGDDELIDINLTTINAQTDSLILLLTAYTSGSEFGDIANLQSRLYIDSVEYLLYNINTVDYPSSEHATAALVLEIYKNHNDGGAWYLRTVDIWTTYLSDGSRIYRADNPNLQPVVTAYRQGPPTPLPYYASY